MTHYIAIAGLHGYMPNYVGLCETYEDAVQVLANIHDLEPDRIEALRTGEYQELDLHVDGNEYCEIVWCDCDNPSQHEEA